MSLPNTIPNIVYDIRRRNRGVPLDGESSHPLAEDMLRLANKIDEAYKDCTNNCEVYSTLQSALRAYLYENEGIVVDESLSASDIMHDLDEFGLASFCEWLYERARY